MLDVSTEHSFGGALVAGALIQSRQSAEASPSKTQNLQVG